VRAKRAAHILPAPSEAWNNNQKPGIVLAVLSSAERQVLGSPRQDTSSRLNLEKTLIPLLLANAQCGVILYGKERYSLA